MSAVKVGQIWQDKDKRRGTVIEILQLDTVAGGAVTVTGLVVGTEEERMYKVERLVARWTMTREAPAEQIKKLDKELETIVKAEKTPAKFKTREQWLEAAVKELTKLFAKHDFVVPPVRVSVGWPGGRGKKTGVVGQCFATSSTTDKVAQIFVSPAVSNSLNVMATMAHELVHAVDDCKSGHKKDFIRIAKTIGFIPEWTSSDNRTDELNDKLKKIVDKLGPFPHAAIRPDDKPTVQKTYMLKVMCTEDPDYFVRMTQTKIEEYGTPFCPCHREEMGVEEK